MQGFLKRRREIRVVKLIVYLFEEVFLRFEQLSLSATQRSIARTLSHESGRSIEKF
jgi:hypothetical protein